MGGVAGGFERCHHFIPRLSVEPQAGDEDDVHELDPNGRIGA
jgi:hypothetical protein